MQPALVPSTALTSRLKLATHAVHRVAERSAIVQRLLRGDVERPTYEALLRNLHALYAALERTLDRHAASPQVAPVRMPELYRARALAIDLRHFCGSRWQARPLARSMLGYLARIDDLATSDAPLIVAHAYVRYMGDLSGGQLLRRAVREGLGLANGNGTAFYDFAGADVGALKTRFHAALDALPVDAGMATAIVAEAARAFEYHLSLFAELEADAEAARNGRRPAPRRHRPPQVPPSSSDA